MKIEIDEEISDQLSRRAKRMGFNSTEDYTLTVLKTVMNELNSSEQNTEVENRLEDLGYL